VGRLLATIPVDKGWGDAELQNTFGSDKAKIEQGRKLLTYRDQIDKQSRQAETAVVERSSRLKSKETTNVEDTHPEINELIRKNEQDVRFRTAAIRGIVDDLKTLADEIDPPAKEGPGQ
jgi:gas vesicle protein